MTIGWRTCENFMPLAFQSYDDVNFSKKIRNSFQFLALEIQNTNLPR